MIDDAAVVFEPLTFGDLDQEAFAAVVDQQIIAM